jgi:hypothetical protein
MSERVERLPSKIVQYDYLDEWALCEDGSVWSYSGHGKMWTQIHPPHEPPAQSGDLAEALAVLRRIIDTDCQEFWPSEIEVREAYEAADALLKKHGA